MADEAAVAVVMRMRDEASADLVNLGGTMAQTEAKAFQMNLALTSIGASLTAVGSLVNQLDNPIAKMGATFLMTAGAMMTTVSAIIQMLPYLRSLVTMLRSVAVAQAIVAALTGPVGWAKIGIGLAVAGAATAGIVAMTGGFGGGEPASIPVPAAPARDRGGGTTVNINAGVLMGDSTQAKQLARMVKRNIDEDTRLGR